MIFFRTRFLSVKKIRQNSIVSIFLICRLKAGWFSCTATKNLVGFSENMTVEGSRIFCFLLFQQFIQSLLFTLICAG